MTKLAFMSSGIPPWICGIADHSGHLIRSLRDQMDIVALAGYGAYAEIPGVQIRCCYDPLRPRTVLAVAGEIAELRPDWLFIQYNPLSFGPRGVNLYLPLMLMRARRLVPDVSVSVMVHELSIWATTWKQRVLVAVQYAQLRAIVRQAAAVFVPVDSWRPALRRYSHVEPRWLPVGSNVPLADVGYMEALRRAGLVERQTALGLFGRTEHPGLAEHVAERRS